MVAMKDMRHGVARRVRSVRWEEWKFVATSCEMMVRSDKLFVSLMYRGAEAMREKCVKDAMAAVEVLQRGRAILQRPKLADVNVVEVARRMR